MRYHCTFTIRPATSKNTNVQNILLLILFFGFKASPQVFVKQNKRIHTPQTGVINESWTKLSCELEIN